MLSETLNILKLVGIKKDSIVRRIFFQPIKCVL